MPTIKLQVKIKPQFKDEFDLDPAFWYGVKEIVNDKIILGNDKLYLRGKFDERSIDETGEVSPSYTGKVEMATTDRLVTINSMSTIDRILRHIVVENPKRVEIRMGGRRYIIKIDDLEFEVYSAHPDYDAVIELNK